MARVQRIFSLQKTETTLCLFICFNAALMSASSQTSSDFRNSRKKLRRERDTMLESRVAHERQSAQFKTKENFGIPFARMEQRERCEEGMGESVCVLSIKERMRNVCNNEQFRWIWFEYYSIIFIFTEKYNVMLPQIRRPEKA